MLLTDLDVATGKVLGGGRVRLPTADLEARPALEQTILAAMLQRRPVVSFSGGRDSSLVLALATHVARREGLPDPVPMTKRYPGVAEADEREWQELVVRHLGLTDWEVVEIRGELDLLGEVATATLRRHGVLWPPNAYLHVPLFERCRGSVLMTGYDGDRLLDDWRYRAVIPSLGKRRPTGSDLRHLSPRFAPSPLIRTRAARRHEMNWWLTDDGLDLAARAEVSERREPLSWRRRLEWFAGRRQTAATIDALVVLSADFDVRTLHPLIEPPVLAGFARTGGHRGWRNRTEALQALATDLLPEVLLTRRTKAIFDQALIGEPTRRFARDWSGRPIRFAESEALRQEWLSPSPVFQSITALHTAWITDNDGQN